MKLRYCTCRVCNPFWSGFFLSLACFCCLLLVLKFFCVCSLLFLLKILKQTNQTSTFSFFWIIICSVLYWKMFYNCLPSIKNSLCPIFPSQKCYRSLHSMNQKFVGRLFSRLYRLLNCNWESYLGILVRYVKTLWNSFSGISPNAENSGKVMTGQPSRPRPPRKKRISFSK